MQRQYREIENEKTAGASESQKPKLKAPPSSRSSRSLKSSVITSNGQKSLDLPAVIVLITVLSIIIGAGVYTIWPRTKPENSEKWVGDTTTRSRPTLQKKALQSKTSQTKSSSQVKASVSKASEKAVTIPISISKIFVPVGMTVAAMSGPLSEPLSETPPTVTLKEPAYRGKSQRYGRLVLGTYEDRSYYYVLDVIDGSHPVLYFDKNQNRDLTDDGPPLNNQGLGFFATSIALPIRQLIKELDTTENFKIWFYTNESIWRHGYTSHYSRTQMQGHVTINNRRYLAYIAERGVNDADFTNDGIYLDLNGNGKIEYRTEFIGHSHAAAIDGGEYRFDIGW